MFLLCSHARESQSPYLARVLRAILVLNYAGYRWSCCVTFLLKTLLDFKTISKNISER